jgi:hypothetical protein
LVLVERIATKWFPWLEEKKSGWILTARAAKEGEEGKRMSIYSWGRIGFCSIGFGPLVITRPSSTPRFIGYFGIFGWITALGTCAHLNQCGSESAPLTQQNRSFRPI